jgi:wyosine [tRNA(Phe)-imidazoG37] synthetase (radical SAM superfamily)
MKKNRRHIYGPVPSRRLGLSLGVDLLPPKICDYDCLYCQLGRTSEWTARISPYIRSEDIMGELKARLEMEPRPDYITMAGSGEPTLNSELERVISSVKELCDIPVAVLTNGSLLGVPQVQRACLLADLVLPSLDAGDEKTFREVNRPCAGIAFADVVEGLVSFREHYEGPIWLEVMILQGINSGDPHIEKIRESIERISPNEVHLNTVRRPPADRSARPVRAERMEEIRSMLGPRAVVIKESASRAGAVAPLDEGELLAFIARRPSTRRQISEVFDINEIEALKQLSRLVEEHLVVSEQVEGEVFYKSLPE